MMASQMSMPTDGHLEAFLHVCKFIRQKYNSRMVFYPTYPTINMSDFKEFKWKYLYGELKEAIPPNYPEERGNKVDLHGYVHIRHAGENKTRRSQSGFFILLNTEIIQWFSKKQSTIDMYVFEADFLAMNIVMEMLRGIRYKMRMMGVPISVPSCIYLDNMLVIHNTQRPEFTMKNKSNYI